EELRDRLVGRLGGSVLVLHTGRLPACGGGGHVGARVRLAARNARDALIRALQRGRFSVRYAPVTAITEQRLADDLARAMKAREMPRVYVLRGLLAAAKNLKVERRGALLAEADLVHLVRREIRKREEAEDFEVKSGREELIAQNRN